MRRPSLHLISTKDIERIFKRKTTITSTPFIWGEEKGFLLKEIDENDFYKFIEKLGAFLNKIIKDLPEKEKSS